MAKKLYVVETSNNSCELQTLVPYPAVAAGSNITVTTATAANGKKTYTVNNAVPACDSPANLKPKPVVTDAGNQSNLYRLPSPAISSETVVGTMTITKASMGARACDTALLLQASVKTYQDRLDTAAPGSAPLGTTTKSAVRVIGGGGFDRLRKNTITVDGNGFEQLNHPETWMVPWSAAGTITVQHIIYKFDTSYMEDAFSHVEVNGISNHNAA